MGLEVVYRALNGFAICERANVLDDEFGLERVGVVEVALVPRVQWKLRQVAIVQVQRKQRRIKLPRKLRRKRGLARARASGNANHERAVRLGSGNSGFRMHAFGWIQ